MTYDIPRRSFSVNIPAPPECPLHYPKSTWDSVRIVSWVSNTPYYEVSYWECGCNMRILKGQMIFTAGPTRYTQEETEKLVDKYMKDTGG